MQAGKNSKRVAGGRPGQGEVLGRQLSDAVIFFHEAIASSLGMSAAEWKCLGLLDVHGAATAGRLAELSGFTTGAITGIVDRLERAGYVRREPNPEDRRSVVVRPLPNHELKEQVMPIFASLGRAMAAVLNRYTPQEQAAIQDYFIRTIDVLKAETAKVSKQRQQPAPGPSKESAR